MQKRPDRDIEDNVLHQMGHEIEDEISECEDLEDLVTADKDLAKNDRPRAQELCKALEKLYYDYMDKDEQAFLSMRDAYSAMKESKANDYTLCKHFDMLLDEFIETRSMSGWITYRYLELDSLLNKKEDPASPKPENTR